MEDYYQLYSSLFSLINTPVKRHIDYFNKSRIPPHKNIIISVLIFLISSSIFAVRDSTTDNIWSDCDCFDAE